MNNPLTLQTEAAFERVYEALIGKTDDDLNHLTLRLKELTHKAEEIQKVSAGMLSGDW
jgi:hypothetical protein